MRLVSAAALLAGLALVPSMASSATRPDLRWTFVTDPPSALAGGAEFSVALAVANTGSGSAASSMARFALSPDARLDPGDTVLGTRRFPRMRAKRETVLGLRVTVPGGTPPGEYFLVGCVDATRRVRETSERNNCFAGATLLAVSAR